MTTNETPFHLRGNFAPVLNEVEAFDLPVQGAIPGGLRGLYVRNGPNPKTGVSPHWFLGDGMLHGVELRDGRARWYKNRWVPAHRRAALLRLRLHGPVARTNARMPPAGSCRARSSRCRARR